MMSLLVSLLTTQDNYAPILGPLTPVSSYASLSRGQSPDLELRVTYPKQPGNYPLIVFSHGFRGTRDTYDPLISTWVSHGYVCVQPNHADSIRFFKGKLRDAFSANARSFGNWSKRPEELSMIIDRFAELETKIVELRKKVDKTKIGVAGHSFGAHTSSLLAGAKPRTGETFKEKRASAFLLLSPQGQGNSFGDDAWKDMTGPVMSVTGSEDVSIVPTTPALRRMPFERSPVGDKYLLWMDGGHHNLGGISGRPFPTSGQPNRTQLTAVQKTTLAFWDAYLKRDSKARAFLESTEVEAVSKGSAHLERR